MISEIQNRIELEEENIEKLVELLGRITIYQYLSNVGISKENHSKVSKEG